MNAGKELNNIKNHGNTGNQNAKRDNSKKSQITFRVDSQIKNDLLKAREELGFKDFTDFMTHISTEFLKSHNAK